MGHVNNAKYLTYCEIARIRYWTDVTGEPIALGTEGAESLILAEARITYRAPAFHGEVVTVQTRATRIGRSSFTLEHRLLACVAGDEPRLVAVSESILVRYDYASSVARGAVAGIRRRHRGVRGSIASERRAARVVAATQTERRATCRSPGRSSRRSGRRTRSR